MSCCETESNGQSAGAAATESELEALQAQVAVLTTDVAELQDAVFAQRSVLYDVNFSELPTQVFTNGVNVIDGHPWNIANVAVAAPGQFGIDNGPGEGLDMQLGTSVAGSFSTLVQTAPLLWIEGATLLGDDYDPLASYSLEVRLTRAVYENQGTALYIGFWNPANSFATYATSARFGGKRQETGNIVTTRVIDSATQQGTVPIPTFDTVGTWIEPDGMGGISIGTWPTLPDPQVWPRLSSVHAFGSASTAVPLLTPATRFFISWNLVSDSSPTTRFTLERFRVRKTWRN